MYTEEDVIEQFGVVKASCEWLGRSKQWDWKALPTCQPLPNPHLRPVPDEGVPLPELRVHTVTAKALGPPREVLAVGQAPLPSELEWGQVLVSIRAAPISPADLFAVQVRLVSLFKLVLPQARPKLLPPNNRRACLATRRQHSPPSHQALLAWAWW